MTQKTTIKLIALIAAMTFTHTALGNSCAAEFAAMPNLRLLYSSGLKAYWISVGAMDEELKQLGFKPAERSARAAVLKQGALNLFQCPNKADSQQMLQSADGRFVLVVVNDCEEKFARQLKFVPFKAENYGSMESGQILKWNQIGLCGDGKALHPCDPKHPMACSRIVRSK